MTDSSAPVYCANHPGVETSLRCKTCGKPICAKCAVPTPTGYSCKECVRSQQRTFITSEWYDYILGFATAGVLSFLACLLVGVISGVAGIFAWLLIIAVAPTAGMIIAEAVRFVTRKRRSRPLFLTVGAGVIVGALPTIVINLLSLNIFGLIFLGIFLFITTPIVYTRLSGIQLTR
jgi:B-box zinc finger